MATHAHTLIEHDGQRAEVDVGIAPLVLALWRAGYVTSSSCEAFAPAGGLAYVAFSPEHAEQAEAFRRIVGPEAQVVVTTAEDVAAAEAQGARSILWALSASASRRAASSRSHAKLLRIHE